MKKIFPVSVLFMTLLLCQQLSAILPSPVGLPQTMSISNQDVYIDVNRDGIGDFYVRFRSNPSGSYCEIYDPLASGSPSPALGTSSPVVINDVLYEDETAIGYFTTILNLGDPISAAGLWYHYASIFRKNNQPLPSPPPLASNYTDGILQGFIGVHYHTPGGMYYGWLPVQIDPNGQWVLIGPGGSGSAPGQSVLAGTGGSAVPIPLIASILGFGLVGGGIFFKRRKKK